MSAGPRLVVDGIAGLPEIVPGADLAALIVDHPDACLHERDVVVITSKVVSKAAGLVRQAQRDDLLPEHTDRVVARRGATAIVRTRQGLTLAAAGLDASNTPIGTVLALPDDPDAEAARLRRSLVRLAGCNVAVVITDTAGRPWRLGQTDIAIGVAGLVPLLDLSGRIDAHGNVLAVTTPALADAVAAVVDLVQGKLAQVPVAIVRGLSGWVLVTGDDGPGAAALLRPEEDDLFGWGAVDAVHAAVCRGDPGRHRGFPLPSTPVEDLIAAALVPADAASVEVARAQPGSAATWDVSARPGAAETAVWEAAAFVERLHALATATRRAVRVERPGPGRTLARVQVVSVPDDQSSPRTLDHPPDDGG